MKVIAECKMNIRVCTLMILQREPVRGATKHTDIEHWINTWISTNGDTVKRVRVLLYVMSTWTETVVELIAAVEVLSAGYIEVGEHVGLIVVHRRRRSKPAVGRVRHGWSW